MSIDPFFGGSTNGDKSLLAPQGQENAYRWATVMDVSPLTILFDGDTVPLGTAPDSLVGDLALDDRVWCQLFGRRVIILGKGYTYA